MRVVDYSRTVLRSRLGNLAERFYDLCALQRRLRKCALKTLVVPGQLSYIGVSDRY